MAEPPRKKLKVMLKAVEGCNRLLQTETSSNKKPATKKKQKTKKQQKDSASPVNDPSEAPRYNHKPDKGEGQVKQSKEANAVDELRWFLMHAAHINTWSKRHWQCLYFICNITAQAA